MRQPLEQLTDLVQARDGDIECRKDDFSRRRFVDVELVKAARLLSPSDRHNRVGRSLILRGRATGHTDERAGRSGKKCTSFHGSDELIW
jgi:hypothetical protein